jgi:hypothetical protein
MIENELQYLNTKKHLKNFQDHRNILMSRIRSNDKNEMIRQKLYIDAANSTIESLEEDMMNWIFRK